MMKEKSVEKVVLYREIITITLGSNQMTRAIPCVLRKV